MKQKIQKALLFIGIFLAAAVASQAQNNSTANSNLKTTTMKTYVIERDMAGASKLTHAQLVSASQNSCSVLTSMGPKIEWVQSYVAGDKIYCIYRAENEDLIREHAKKAGLPCNKVTEVANVISPATAKE